MKPESLHIGQRVRHPQYGLGTVHSLTAQVAGIRFDDGAQRQVSPTGSGMEPAEAQAQLHGLELPLGQLIQETVEAALHALGVERPDRVVDRLGSRWHGGRVVLHPNDPALQTREIELEVFFHKIVMVRDKTRLLEQKINANPKLTDAEKVELQQYITGIYGSMTTFNVLFRDKEDQF
jgi:hypothetical protein